ncbi:hypothetical protein FH972_002149 [Carpinus fangiana]|uniref:RING-CH-type domain-containing protein n=1 Tax=Carpinus fangiana TaxID=176857 RepID=A0A5N6QH96_9ROSI|nr:hypothetical protein FH972_002149 [Carpinus fangiana]
MREKKKLGSEPVTLHSFSAFLVAIPLILERVSDSGSAADFVAEVLVAFAGSGEASGKADRKSFPVKGLLWRGFLGSGPVSSLLVLGAKEAASPQQLVSNDSHREDISETEPILSRPGNLQRSEESSSSSLSCEITTVGGDFSVINDDSQNLHLDESRHLVNTDQPQCRICLDSGGEDLIAPCHCKGTQKYVHRSCLDNWRSTKEGFAFAHCTECRAMFILRANVPPDRWWLRLKFQFLVARDHAFIFIIVQLV